MRVISTLFLARLHQWQRDKTGWPNRGNHASWIAAEGHHTHTQDVICSEHNVYQKQANKSTTADVRMASLGNREKYRFSFFYY